MCSEVVGQTGFLVLGLDGAVLSSGGDLQADQRWVGVEEGVLVVLVEVSGAGGGVRGAGAHWPSVRASLA